MSNLRKTPGRSGRRSVRGGAIFAALALALSMSAFIGAGTASAGGEQSHNATCGQGENEIDAQNFKEHHCYTVDTPLDGAHFPLGTPVHDTATVTKKVEEKDPCAASDEICNEEFQIQKSGTVDFLFFNGSGCEGEPRSSDLGVPIDFPDDQSSADSGSVTLPAGSYSALATFNGTISWGRGSISFFAEGVCENFTVDPATPVVNTEIIQDSTSDNGPVVHDTATVSGVDGFPPTGEVSFTFFDNGTCSGSGSSVSTDGLVGGSAESSSVGPLAAGSYSFLAHYDPDGDTNYVATDGPCEPLLVNTTTTTETVVQPQTVLRPVIVVQPVQQPQVVEVSPATAVRATGTFTG